MEVRIGGYHVSVFPLALRLSSLLPYSAQCTVSFIVANSDICFNDRQLRPETAGSLLAAESGSALVEFVCLCMFVHVCPRTRIPDPLSDHKNFRTDSTECILSFSLIRFLPSSVCLSDVSSCPCVLSLSFLPGIDV
jgi:hypothetical protein